MNAFETLAILSALRIILPLGLLFLFGELIRNRESRSYPGR